LISRQFNVLTRVVVAFGFIAALLMGAASAAEKPLVAVMPVFKDAPYPDNHSERLTQQLIIEISATGAFRARAAHFMCDSAELGAEHIGARLYVVSEASKNERHITMGLYHVGKKSPLRTVNVDMNAWGIPQPAVDDLMDQRQWLASRKPSITC